MTTSLAYAFCVTSLRVSSLLGLGERNPNSEVAVILVEIISGPVFEINLGLSPCDRNFDLAVLLR